MHVRCKPCVESNRESDGPMKTAAEVQAEFDRRKHQSQTDRRKYAEGCSFCESIKTRDNGNGPRHDASERCRCGYHEHCSCSACWTWLLAAGLSLMTVFGGGFA